MFHMIGISLAVTMSLSDVRYQPSNTVPDPLDPLISTAPVEALLAYLLASLRSASRAHMKTYTLCIIQSVASTCGWQWKLPRSVHALHKTNSLGSSHSCSTSSRVKHLYMCPASSANTCLLRGSIISRRVYGRRRTVLERHLED